MATRTQTRSGRFYEVDGEMFPSVTNILGIINKPALIPWAAKVERELVLECSSELYLDAPAEPRMSKTAWITTMQQRLGKARAHTRELQKAGDIGSQVHALIEWTLKAKLMYEAGPSPRITDAAQWAFMAFEDWAKSVDLKPILVEQIVYSKEYQYAGTLDLLAEVKGILTLVDFKTGKAIYGEAHLQNAAYRHALREMGHGDAQQGMIVRLPKVETDPEFEAVVADDEKESLGRFLSAMSVWQWQQQKEAEYEAKKEQQETVAA